MKKTNIIYAAGLALFIGASLASCDDYLSELPDNRTQIDSEDKVVKLLTAAYPNACPIVMAECVSDNIDDMGERYSNYTSRFYDQLYNLQDLTEMDNDGPYFVWSGYYEAIANANQALQAIEEMGGPTTQTLREAMAEALLCRAYSHYMLTYLFCLDYDPATSSTVLGLTYMTEPETTVFPHYERESLQSMYEKIDKDIQTALPMVGDTHLSVPKYHFNSQAAYAFAARFYLAYQKWDLAVRYASECLGSAPETLLRDWDAINAIATPSSLDPQTNEYIDAAANANFLLVTATSNVGYWAGNSLLGNCKYTHDAYLASTEDLTATNIWGGTSLLRYRPKEYSSGTFDRVLVAKMPALMNWADAQHSTYYLMTVYAAFKADLTLLERAEAYILLKEYEKACDDLNLWMHNWTKSNMTLTPENIRSFYNSMSYATWNAPTLKKHLNPSFEIDEEGSIQECMLQCVLNFKRIETLYEGYRWFDLKRYGITVYRRTMNASGTPEEVTDSMLVDDPRRALQLPAEAINAGYTPNPR